MNEVYRNRFTVFVCTAFLCSLNLFPVSQAYAQESILYLTDAPVWMHYFCDASENDPNGSVSLQGTHCYQNFTLPASATLTVTATFGSGSPQNVPLGAVDIYATGACTIAGTVNASALQTSVGNGGGAGGGGGGWVSSSGSAGGDSDVFGSASITRLAAGAAGGLPGQKGANALSPQPASQKFVAEKFMTLGSPGGAAGGKGGGGSKGGSGGGGVMFICGSINFTGQINANGGDGAAGAGGIGGGGGGGGGVVIMAAQNYIANSQAISVAGGTGGAGGSGAGDGGNGGNGWFSQFVLQ